MSNREQEKKDKVKQEFLQRAVNIGDYLSTVGVIRRGSDVHIELNRLLMELWQYTESKKVEWQKEAREEERERFKRAYLKGNVPYVG